LGAVGGGGLWWVLLWLGRVFLVAVVGGGWAVGGGVGVGVWRWVWWGWVGWCGGCSAGGWAGGFEISGVWGVRWGGGGEWWFGGVVVTAGWGCVIRGWGWYVHDVCADELGSRGVGPAMVRGVG